MATQQQITEVKVLLNNEQAKRQVDELQKKYEDLKKKRDDALVAGDIKAWKKYQSELDKTGRELDKMQTSQQRVNRALDNLSTAKPKELSQTLREVNRLLDSGDVARNSEQWKSLQAVISQVNQELRTIRDESRASQEALGDKDAGIWESFEKFNKVGFMFNNIIGMGSGLSGLIDKVKDLAGEAANAAREAEGIEMAFRRIDNPGLLDNLRRATHGTVSDIELMKQAVQFKDFNLDVEQLGNFLAFAQQKAKDTGQSIDYLVNSIVTGLGRQSKQILDNLGISAAEITEEMQQSGDMVQAVSVIVERNMKNAGQYVETSADRAARATARQQNAMVELGRKMLPLKEQAEGLYASFQTGTIKTVEWVYEHRKSMTALAAAYAVYQVAVSTATIKETAHNVVQKAGNLLTQTRTVVVEGARLAYARLTGNLDMATAAQARLNAVQKANVFLAVAAAVITLVTAIGDLIEHSRKLTDAQQAMHDAMTECAHQMVDEREENKRLARAISDTALSQDERNKAIERFNDKLADNHLNLLSEEEIRTGNVRDRLKELNEATEDRLYLMALEDKHRALLKKRADIEIDGVETSWYQDVWDWVNGAAGIRVTDRKKNALAQIDRQIEDLHAHIWQKNAQMEEKRRISEGVVIVGHDRSKEKKDDDDENKSNRAKKDPYEEGLRRLQEAQEKERDLQRLARAQRLTDEEELQQSLYEIDMRYLAKRMELQKKYGRDTTKTEVAVYDRIEQESRRRYDVQKKEFDTWYGNAKTRQEAEKKARLKREEEERKLSQNLSALERRVTENIIRNKKEEEQKERETAQTRQQVQQAAYQELTATMHTASQLFSALQQSEIDRVETRYDRQIEAAQKAGRDTTKLEKKKEAEVNAIKRRYADREFVMKVLEITADTAVAITRQFKDLPFFAALGTSALIAAQGAMQLAVAKQQQQQARQSGYYEGGFTGGRRYRREAGVVHEGEFVANHEAVQNPQLLPMLQVIDAAQKSNTVSTLTAHDVTVAMGHAKGEGAAVVSAPTVNVTTDNAELRNLLEMNHSVLDELAHQLEQGIRSFSVIDGPDGTYQMLRRYQRLLDNK